jgi:lantibiotic biosynthesis protein
MIARSGVAARETGVGVPMGSATADFFVLRSPLLPYDDLSAWSADLAASGVLDDDEQLTTALAADRALLRSRLAEIIARPEVRDALYVASPDLDASVDDWLADPDSRRGRRVERALVRYLERMGARSTPFGLFAGCAVGRIGAETTFRLPARTEQRRHTRLDMLYLCGLIDALERDPLIRAQLRFRPSSSLYRLGDRWHWIELTPNDARHSHRYQRRPTGPWLDRLIEIARDGATLAELLGALDGIELEPEPALLDSLVDQQLLVSDLQPAVTGPEPIHGLIERLDALAPGSPLATQAATTLRAVRGHLHCLDEAGLGADPSAYRSITTPLEALPGPVDRARLFQAELVKTPKEDAADGLVLGADILAEIGRGVEILRRLHHPDRSSLARFRERFIARYEGTGVRREVPLVDALDPELGLGFGPTTGHDGGTPLLESLELPTGSDGHVAQWGPRQTLLLVKLSEALTVGATEIELSDADLDRLANEEPLPLPNAFAVSAVAAASSQAALARGDVRLFVMGVSGPSGARMLGRFCHGDPVLHEHVARHVRAEVPSQPDAIVAEIAHLPEPRAGNILHRPRLREYEIAYLAASGAPIERQIPISDLLVSVDGERVVLRSARLGHEVLPRLTSAQNYFHGRTIVLYRFLAALQDQGVATKLGWDWGPLANAPFLPRVTSGRLVLGRARWRISAAEAGRLTGLRGAELFRAVQDWRSGRGIPRHARLADADNELLLDFDNVLSVESFAQLIAGHDQSVLVEAFPGPDELCVRGPDGRFFHELLIPFLQASPASASTDAGRFPNTSAFENREMSDRPARPPQRDLVRDAQQQLTCHRVSPGAITRHFPPGSAWLFAKLYAAPSAVDGLLRSVVRPFINQTLSSGAADGWFFVRYGDPDWHLRLRLHGDPARICAEVLPQLQEAVAPLLESGQIRHLVLDTYEREVERYGGPTGMPLCEQLFQADSEAVLEIVAALDDVELAVSRAQIAVAGMDVLLDGLGLSLEERLAVAALCRDRFAREHRADQKVLRQIGERYRVERVGVEALFEASVATDKGMPWSTRAAGALSRLTRGTSPAMTRLRAAAERGELSTPLSALAPSLLHMHVNRLLHTDHQRQEMVLYDFLYRFYDAREARMRGASV